MYNPIHTFQDKRFAIHKQQEYDLIISCGEDNIRLMCIDTRNHCLCAETHYLSQIPPADNPVLPTQHFFNNHPFIAQQGWRKITYLIANKWYTLVPTALYQPAQIADYLNLAVALPTNMHLCDSPTVQHTTVVYALPAALFDWLNTIYPTNQLTITHQTSAIITSAQYYGEDKPIPTAPQVFVVTEGSHMHITVMRNAQLQYCNRFEYHTGDDWLQYLLTVMHVLQLNPQKSQLLLAGDIAKNTPIHKKLRIYIPHIAFVQPPPALRMRWLSNKSFLVSYFTLLNFWLHAEAR